MTAWLAATQLAPHLAGPATIAVAAALGWGLRFWLAPATVAWRRGAAGERRMARAAGPPGAARLGGAARPGHPRRKANVDHLVIGPGGVVVIDSKRYRGRLRLDADGLLVHGRHLLVPALRTTLWEADQADEVVGVADLRVAAVMAVDGTKVPWGRLQADGVLAAPAQRVPDLLRALPPLLGARAGGLASRPSPAGVPRRRLTTSDQQRPGALLSSERLRVERRAES